MSDVGMKPKDAAKILRVHPKTLARWADDGKIRYALTPGGHRRYSTDDIIHMLHIPENNEDKDARPPIQRDTQG